MQNRASLHPLWLARPGQLAQGAAGPGGRVEDLRALPWLSDGEIGPAGQRKHAAGYVCQLLPGHALR